ncbi:MULTISPECIES: hypothetical protein [unclassified Pseudoalteromonas]|uniref:hypothetical protein n=1 Tax=unclassified Pseudoalteromonas TaxID=194690 RepID=UPI00209798D2|nr:hypothetical protein [Pseudoalteromonas sp. XMcav2-N]MCO7187401.1 hypothetical protein [Pseudoalteromonas sp. XMcav2-N]
MIIKNKMTILCVAASLLSGCSYFFGENIKLENCFTPYSVSQHQSTLNLYKHPFDASETYFVDAGYAFRISVDYTVNSRPSLFPNNRDFLEQDLELTGDMIIGVPDWAHKHLGGSQIGVDLPATYESQVGVLSVLAMKNAEIDYPKDVAPHCKKAMKEICEGKSCRFASLYN